MTCNQTDCKQKKCPYEGNDLSWVERRGGCPFNQPRRPETAQERKFRVGQQKQKFSDRGYSSKNDRKGKF
jgi:hypothetical protein